MSEIAPESTVSESVPTSTADTAAQVIDSYESADAEGEVSGDTPDLGTATDTTEAVADVKAQIAELSAAAKFLEAQGHKPKKADGRDNWLPLKTVEKMLDRYAGQHLAGLSTEKTTIETEAKSLREQMEEMRADITGDTRAFLTKLSGYDPRYKAFLEPQAAPEPPRVDDTEPQPDIDLGNGQWTYSQEQNDKRIEWKARQLLDARLKPWEEREKAEKAERAREQMTTQVRERASKQLQTAQTWPLFGTMAGDGSLTPFQSEVLEAFRGDPSSTLRQAYLEVYAKHQEPDKIRERVLAELQSAPKGTAVPRAGGESPRAPKSLSTADHAAKALERLERGT